MATTEQQQAEVLTRKTPTFDVALYDIATKRQCEYLAALSAHPTYGEAAEAVGVSALTLYQAYRKLAKRAAQEGVIPLDSAVLPGCLVQERTVALDQNGNITKQWVRSKADAAEQAPA